MTKKTVVQKTGWKLFLMLSAFIWSAFMPAVSSAEWAIEELDAATIFDSFSQRSIAIDSAGRPHIAYGGVHLYHAYFDGVQWQTEVVDHALRTGKYASIAIDSNDNVHISYFDWDIIPVEGSGEYALKYATNATGTWVTETLGEERVGPISIAVDSNDNVHIGFYAAFYSALKYATNATGTWVIETLDPQGPLGSVELLMEFPTIAIDSNDKVHIGYFNGVGSFLKHITNASGAWVVEDVPTINRAISMAIDSNDKLHISSIGAYLQYTTNASGAWLVENVDVISRVDGGPPGLSTSIAVDSNNSAHISYFNGTHGGISGLRYATNASGAWVTETFNGEGLVRSTSIAIDSSDNVHFSYHDIRNRNLKYATNASGAWVIETVDPEMMAGQGTSVAIDSNDNVHISYFDFLKGDHMYTTNASGAWVVEVITKGYQNSEYDSSIAIDSNDNVHIGYSGGAGIEHATNVSGAWVVELIDNTALTTGNLSIAIDSTNKVHISYATRNSGSSGALKYVTNATGAWVIATVDEGYIKSTSLAIDSNDTVHISYSDRNSLIGNYDYDINYATPAAGGWSIETLATDEIDTWGHNTAIAVDSNDNVHISYIAGSFGLAMYATNASGTWVVESVGSSVAPSMHGISMAIDSNDTVHIGYQGPMGLTDATNASGAWVVELVDADRSTISHLALAIDSNDNVHISYYTTTGSYAVTGYGHVHVGDFDHKYATNAPSVQTVSATADPGGSISPSGDVIVATGSDQTFTITPGKGYRILDVLVDGVSIGRVESYTFTNVSSGHTIHAKFTRKHKMHGRKGRYH